MANHKAAKKSIRQTIVRNDRNKSRISEMRTIVKQVETMVGQNNHTSAMEALRIVQSKMMQNVKKGLVKLNAASRKISRLTSKVKSISKV